MFKISCKELHCRRVTKPIKRIDKLFKGPCFDELLESGAKVEIPTAFSEVFKRYSRIINPEGGGKKVWAFYSLRLFEAICKTWSEL